MEFRAYGRRKIWPWSLDLSVSTKMFLRLKLILSEHANVGYVSLKPSV